MNGESGRPSPNQGGTTECVKPSSLSSGMEAFVFLQTVQNGHQLRSGIESILNISQRVCRGYFLRLRPCLGKGASRRARGGRVRMSDFLSSLMKRGVHT